MDDRPSMISFYKKNGEFDTLAYRRYIDDLKDLQDRGRQHTVADYLALGVVFVIGLIALLIMGIVWLVVNVVKFIVAVVLGIWKFIVAHWVGILLAIVGVIFLVGFVEWVKEERKLKAKKSRARGKGVHRNLK